MQKFFDKLYNQSVNSKFFTELMEIISNENNIKLTYRNIKSNNESCTGGADDKTTIGIMDIETEEYARYI